jgi:hypothetical protein
MGEASCKVISYTQSSSLRKDHTLRASTLFRGVSQTQQCSIGFVTSTVQGMPKTSRLQTQTLDVEAEHRFRMKIRCSTLRNEAFGRRLLTTILMVVECGPLF